MTHIRHDEENDNVAFKRAVKAARDYLRKRTESPKNFGQSSTYTPPTPEPTEHKLTLDRLKAVLCMFESNDDRNDKQYIFLKDILANHPKITRNQLEVATIIVNENYEGE